MNFAKVNSPKAVIPAETSAHFDRLFETSSNPRATASKQTMQNIVMVTLQTVQFSLDIAELADLSGNQLPAKIKGLVGLRISKTYNKG